MKTEFRYKQSSNARLLYKEGLSSEPPLDWMEAMGGVENFILEQPQLSLADNRRVLYFIKSEFDEGVEEVWVGRFIMGLPFKHEEFFYYDLGKSHYFSFELPLLSFSQLNLWEKQGRETLKKAGKVIAPTFRLTYTTEVSSKLSLNATLDFFEEYHQEVDY